MLYLYQLKKNILSELIFQCYCVLKTNLPFTLLSVVEDTSFSPNLDKLKSSSKLIVDTVEVSTGNNPSASTVS